MRLRARAFDAAGAMAERVVDVAVGASTPSYLPVVPGAYGPGMDTRAAYGGNGDPAILHVTTLDGSGPGSLRAALEASGPRVVVFDVAGTIDWTHEPDDPTISDPYITVAGQTAPSPGILVRGRTLRLEASHVLLQHIRLRVGDDPGGTSPGRRDCLRILGRDTLHHIVLDHLSASWSVDELVSAYDCHALTIWRPIFSEPLHDSLHPDGPHSKCLFFAERAGLNPAGAEHGVMVAGGLLCHSDDRTPAQKSDTHVIATGNAFYNWANGHALVVWDNDGLGPSSGTYAGNLFDEGPNAEAGSDAGKFYDTRLNDRSRFYVAGNRYNDREPADPWSIFHTSDLSFDIRASDPTDAVWHPSIPSVPDSAGVRSAVAAHAGCRPLDRDAVDERVVAEWLAGEGGLKDSVADAGGWPDLAENVRPWPEPADPHADAGSGYTNLEVALHRDAAAVEP